MALFSRPKNDGFTEDDDRRRKFLEHVESMLVADRKIFSESQTEYLTRIGRSEEHYDIGEIIGTGMVKSDKSSSVESARSFLARILKSEDIEAAVNIIFETEVCYRGEGEQGYITKASAIVLRLKPDYFD